MSIMGPHPQYRAPFNPDGFKTAGELAAFLAHRYFRKAKAGQPFLLVTNLLKNELAVCRFTSSEYEDRLNTECYVGVLGDDPQVIGFDRKDGGDLISLVTQAIRLRTKAFVALKGELTIERGPLELDDHQLLKTPLKKPFPEPPGFLTVSRRGVVSAIVFACGLPAMERACLREARHRRDLLVGYVRAAARLELPLLSTRMKKARLALEHQFISELIGLHLDVLQTETFSSKLEKKLERIRTLLALLRELGTDRCASTVRIKIKGMRFRPAEVIEDLTQAYPTRSRRPQK